MEAGPFSISDIVKLTGTHEELVRVSLDKLQAIGLLGSSNSKSSPGYILLPDSGYVFGVDLGGTKIMAAIADLSGRIVAELTEATDSRGDFHVLNQIRQIAARLLARVSLGALDIRAIAVGIPGAVDPVTGVTSLLPNIEGFGELHIGDGLAERFDCTVVVENDVNMAVLGEAWRGSAIGRKHVSFLSLGTGVGLGNIVAGKLLRGISGAAGEIAFMPIGRDLTSSDARKYGSFELEVGTQGIVARCRSLGATSVNSAKDVFDLLENGDRAAIQTIEETARYIALAITSVQFLFDPELVVLGGSIGTRMELVSRIANILPELAAKPVQIVASGLGSRAGLFGAISLAIGQALSEQLDEPQANPNETAARISVATAMQRI